MTADLYYETARKLVLKDGREVFVRQLNAGDAEAMLVYLQKTAQETHFLMRLPEEAVYTLENERKILQNTRESKQTFMLGALTQDGSVVGNVGVFPIGERFKVSGEPWNCSSSGILEYRSGDGAHKRRD